jgi:hypothetical protein
MVEVGSNTLVLVGIIAMVDELKTDRGWKWFNLSFFFFFLEKLVVSEIGWLQFTSYNKITIFVTVTHMVCGDSKIQLLLLLLKPLKSKWVCYVSNNLRERKSFCVVDSMWIMCVWLYDQREREGKDRKKTCPFLPCLFRSPFSPQEIGERIKGKRKECYKWHFTKSFRLCEEKKLPATC